MLPRAVKTAVKSLIGNTGLYHAMRTALLRRRAQRELRAWEQMGRPLPPPQGYKHRVLREYRRTFGTRVLVETGTYLGDTVEAMRHEFGRVISIELSSELHASACRRFAGIRNVELLHGDSGKILGGVVASLDEPALFWLDGHYSAGVTARGDEDTPIVAELNGIFASSRADHVLLIDDARCFGTDPAYPTLDELTNLVLSHRPSMSVETRNDIIRITP